MGVVNDSQIPDIIREKVFLWKTLMTDIDNVKITLKQ